MIRGLPLLTTALFGLVACASGPSQGELRAMGHPEVVFLQPVADLTVWNYPVTPGAGLLCFQSGAIGAAMCELYQDQASIAHGRAVAPHDGPLAARADETRALGFSDRAYALFSAVMADTPWLADKPVKRVVWGLPQVQYTRDSNADSVVYCMPVFTLDPDGHRFHIDVLAGVQKLAPGYPGDIYDMRKRSFSFTHDLAKQDQGLSYDERRERAIQAASLPAEAALQQWFQDNGAELKADFAADMREVDKGLRDLFGAQTKTPGN